MWDWDFVVRRGERVEMFGILLEQLRFRGAVKSRAFPDKEEAAVNLYARQHLTQTIILRSFRIFSDTK